MKAYFSTSLLKFNISNYDNLRAETNIYRKMENPSWKIKKNFVRRLIKISCSLPPCSAGIPEIESDNPTGCILSDSGGIILSASRGMVVLYFNRIIEVKQDCNYCIENEILKSAPCKIYREIYHYI